MRKLNSVSFSGLAAIMLLLFWSSPTAAQPVPISAWKPGTNISEVKKVIEPTLEKIPKRLRDKVFGNGCKILVVPTVARYMNAGYSQKPRGYTDGGGYDNADGLFVPAKNHLLISEKVSYRNSAPYKSDRIPYVLCHEFGHAYDHYLSSKLNGRNASAMPKFLKTHTSEVKRLTNNQRSSLAYFCQPGTAGASETFAEFFVVFCNGNKMSRTQKRLVSAFPLSRKLVEQVFNSPEVVSSWVRY